MGRRLRPLVGWLCLCMGAQVKCTRCGHCSNTYDSFLDLSLEIHGKVRHTYHIHNQTATGSHHHSNALTILVHHASYTLLERPPNHPPTGPWVSDCRIVFDLTVSTNSFNGHTMSTMSTSPGKRPIRHNVFYWDGVV